MKTIKITIMTKEVSLNECGSCKHWRNGGGNMGRCMLSKSKHPMMFSGCGLFTREDFGCKLYKSSKPAIEQSEDYFCAKNKIGQRCSTQCLGCFQFENDK